MTTAVLKKALVAMAAVIAAVVVALAFLLNTTTGLRWTLEQVLDRSGVPVTVARAEGRLISGFALSGIVYQDPGSGTAVRIDRLELAWRAAALLNGVLHVTSVHASDIEYAQGTAEETAGPDQPPAGPPSLPLEVQVDRLVVESVSVDTGTGKPTRIQRASLRARVDADSISLAGLEVDMDRYGVEGGRLRLGLGPDRPLHGELSWRARPADLPRFTGTLDVSGALAATLEPKIEIHQPFQARAEGTVQGLADEPAWTLDADIPAAVALDQLNPAWPHVSVQGGLRAQGDTGQARLQPSLSVDYAGVSGLLTGDATVTAGELAVASARFERSGADDVVALAGRLGFADALPFRVEGTWESLQGPPRAPWSSPSGEFRAEGDTRALTARLSGRVVPPDSNEAAPLELDLQARELDAAPAIIAEARLPYFTYADVSVGNLDARIDFHTRETEASKVRIDAASLQAGGRRLTDVSVQAGGSIGRHEITLAADTDEGALQAGLRGAYEQGSWRGSVQELVLDSRLAVLPGRWRLAEATGATWLDSRAELDELCLVQEDARLCAGGSLKPGEEWSLDAQARGLPLSWLAASAPEPVSVQGTLAAEVQLGDQGAGLQGGGRIRLDRATVDWKGEDPFTTRYRDVALTASLDTDVLRLGLEGKVDEAGVLDGNVTLAQPLAPDGAISGELTARLPSLRLLRAAVPDLGVEGGSARLSIRIAGTRSAPRFSGEANIENAAVRIDALGVRLTALSVTARSVNERRLELEARATAGDGKLMADGWVEWPPEGGLRGELNLDGEGAELVSLPRAVVVGSPDLQVRVDEQGGRVTGRIRITSARLTPQGGQPGVTLSDDFVVVGREAEAPASTNPMGWHATVTLELGEDTHFRGYGLRGRLTGSIELDAPPQQPTRATGAIEVKNGRYNFYGRTFDIERGRIVYTGGLLDNPGIEVQVRREVGQVSVTLSVSGPLVEPRVSMSSTPSLSETDQMSYLLLGRPASQASGAEAGLLIRAAASLMPGGADGISSSVQSTLGLDTLEVRSETADTEGAAVVLGKYLSPKLYVSYVAGLQHAVDVFRVRYELARHWLVQAESSMEGSGGDILFTW